MKTNGIILAILFKNDKSHDIIVIKAIIKLLLNKGRNDSYEKNN